MSVPPLLSVSTQAAHTHTRPKKREEKEVAPKNRRRRRNPEEMYISEPSI
jgi:hypothetical protein